MSIPSLLMVPVLGKAGRLYSQIPDTGAGDLDFTRVGDTATRVNEAGVVENVPANVPRIDYTSGGCGKLLLEPQRTNILSNREVMATESITVLAGSHALSFYGTGSVTLSGAATGTLNGTGANERVILLFTASAGTLTVTVSGSCTKGQIEAGSYATSYIYSLTGATVTRGADVCSKTGISSLIGQAEGTIYVEEQYDASVANNGGVDDTLVALTDGSTNNLILVLHYGVATGGFSNAVRFFIRTSNVNQVLIDSAALASGVYKIALAYSNNDVVAYINGVLIGTDTSATIPATSVVTLVDPIVTNAATKTVNTKSVALYTTRLTNAELAALTTL
jgi:hypothetical protein